MTNKSTTAPSPIQAVHQTPLGAMTSTWTDAGLYSLYWEQAPEPESIQNGIQDGLANDVPSQDLDDRLNEYFATGRADFESIVVDTDKWTGFTEDIYRCCRLIQPGTTMTYKELAGRAGSPLASRAVGAAMARNRVLLVIPCHRVISTGGGLRGFSAPGGLQTKQFLLDLEAE